MFFKIKHRCIRCRKPMRNDGTEDEPIYQCDNPKCVRYVPKKVVEPEVVEEPPVEPETEAPAELPKEETAPIEPVEKTEESEQAAPAE